MFLIYCNNFILSFCYYIGEFSSVIKQYDNCLLFLYSSLLYHLQFLWKKSISYIINIKYKLLPFYHFLLQEYRVKKFMNNIENFYSVINGFPVMQSCADEYMINKNHFEIINDNKV